MRGEQDSQIGLLTLTSPGKRVPATHPIREIKRLADEALRQLDRTFDEMYSAIGRPSIPPERLLKAQLRSSRCTRCGLSASSASGSTTTFSSGFSST